ncbi:MAG: hypothetical protein R3B47_19965 [Bacteroidia bacterium]
MHILIDNSRGYGASHWQLSDIQKKSPAPAFGAASKEKVSGRKGSFSFTFPFAGLFLCKLAFA